MMITDKWVLLADDDQDDIEVLTDCIRGIAPNTVLISFTDGKKVTDFLFDPVNARYLPCIMLLDYHMPHLNGGEVLASIKHDQRFKGVYKLVRSVTALPFIIDMCFQHGADDYIAKPSSTGGFAELAKRDIELMEQSKP